MKHKIEDCIGSRLRGLSRAVDSIYRKHLHGKGVTESQLSVLMVIMKKGEVEQIEVGRVLNLERSSLSRNLVRLEEQGYIVKTGPLNRPILALTNTGKQFLEQVIPCWQEAMDEIHELLGADAIDGFNSFEKGFK